jgi:hypothetical protein
MGVNTTDSSYLNYVNGLKQPSAANGYESAVVSEVRSVGSSTNTGSSLTQTLNQIASTQTGDTPDSK